MLAIISGVVLGVDHALAPPTGRHCASGAPANVGTCLLQIKIFILWNCHSMKILSNIGKRYFSQQDDLEPMYGRVSPIKGVKRPQTAKKAVLY